MVNKNVCITGITGNVGMACMRHAACLGWNIESATREYKRDLTDWQKTQEWIDECDPFDLVVMTHGVQQTATISDITESSWRNIVGNNLDASMSLSHALLNANKVNDGALVIYFSSIQATQPRTGRVAYAAAKAGIEGLARAMAVELFPLQARAIALRIGQMMASMKGITFTQEQMSKIEEMIPLPLVSADDIATLVFDLYEQRSLTGTVIDIDSGHSLNIWR